jgi:hypothetical protein
MGRPARGPRQRQRADARHSPANSHGISSFRIVVDERAAPGGRGGRDRPRTGASKRYGGRRARDNAAGAEFGCGDGTGWQT